MDLINRFSSRRQKLSETFLNQRLKNARTYKRIAGYFRSSIFELIGEAVEKIEKVQIVCNSELDIRDLAVSANIRNSALLEKWNSVAPEFESLLYRERYKRLYELLNKGNIEIKVVPKDKIFIHGKAGVIELYDGSKTCFIGSVNESKSAFELNYEIVWEDTSVEGVKWVEEEFEALWSVAYPLPDIIIYEIKRISERTEIKLGDIFSIQELPGATFVETPIYRSGEQLQPWQRSFVTNFIEHRETYDKARVILADEVGLGKTLSMAAAAIISILLGDGPVLILCPANLTLQWQTELIDKLGVPSSVWLSNKKVWLDYKGHEIKTRGAEDITNCPTQIAIVSTGLIFHNSDEKEYLLNFKYGTVILDEAHRARRRNNLNRSNFEPNNLLNFMLSIADKTKNIILGTATPIQTDILDLWDLLRILNTDAEFVLGRNDFTLWSNIEKVLPFIKGEKVPSDENEAWELIRCPLPPGNEDNLFYNIRSILNIPDKKFYAGVSLSSNYSIKVLISNHALSQEFFKKNNPLVRHIVLRKRETLEQKGLLEKIGVIIHPTEDDQILVTNEIQFSNFALVTDNFFRQVYNKIEQFIAEIGITHRISGLLKSILYQRICSSYASALSTAQRILERHEFDEDEDTPSEIHSFLCRNLSANERKPLEEIIDILSNSNAIDPKTKAVKFFLSEYQTENKTWLELGCIIFSQYYETVYALAKDLSQYFTYEPIAIYAGAGKSGIFRYNEFSNVDRDYIKRAVKNYEIRLVIATDAACEGLNLQALGTLINLDLPWNPSRLEQRLGRIKRIGQKRQNVDMLNLVYKDTLDEKIYTVLSKRMKDRYDIFGTLPDTIEDTWINDIEQFEEEIDKYIHLRKQTFDAFELRYESQVDPNQNRWEFCSKVLSRKDIIEILSKPW